MSREQGAKKMRQHRDLRRSRLFSKITPNLPKTPSSLRYVQGGLKALSRLEVPPISEIGYRENYASYELDGTIRPTQYYVGDSRRRIFAERSGEILDNDR